MSMESLKALTKKLVEAYGPSGNEETIAKLIQEEIRPYADDVRVDALGNVIAHKKGNGKKVMMAAHMDEIGVIVTHIDQNGFLRFSNLGGLSPAVLMGERCVFANGTVGVFGSEKLDSIKDLELAKMFVDIGAKDRAEAETKVQIGDTAGAYRECTDLGNRMVAKSMDDRIACVILIEAMKQIKSTVNDLYFVFTVQEELGIRGARTAAYGVSPDYGIAIDVTRTGDTPNSITMEVALGNGPAIKVKDSSLICHPKVKQLMVDTAKREEIKYQMEVLEAGGTDSGAIHLTKDGVPSGVISVPCRYIHTPSEMVDMGDVAGCIQLLTAILETPLN